MDHYLNLRDLLKKRERDRNLIQRNSGWKISQPGDKIRYPNPGSPQIPNKMSQRDSPGNIIIKWSEFTDKERNLKAAKESNLFLTKEFA